MENKRCGKCYRGEPEVEFYAGSRKTCKSCRQKQNKKWYAENRSLRGKTVKAWRDKNKERVAANRTAWGLKNKNRVKEKRLAAYQRNRDRYLSASKEYRTNKYYSDPSFKIAVCCRARIRDALKGKRKGSRLTTLLGCQISDLKKYLENKFLDGMSWGNYGPTWHIDHIRPCASFDLSDPEQQKLCFHYTNLQPLWASDNIKKSDTWEPIKIGQATPTSTASTSTTTSSSPPTPVTQTL